MPLTSQHALRFELNGAPRELSVPAHLRLIDLLRDELGLTGTKEGCSVGVCGACSVLVAGQLLPACLLPPALVDGTRATTTHTLSPAARPGEGPRPGRGSAGNLAAGWWSVARHACQASWRAGDSRPGATSAGRAGAGGAAVLPCAGDHLWPRRDSAHQKSGHDRWQR